MLLLKEHISEFFQNYDQGLKACVLIFQFLKRSNIDINNWILSLTSNIELKQSRTKVNLVGIISTPNI